MPFTRENALAHAAARSRLHEGGAAPDALLTRALRPSEAQDAEEAPHLLHLLHALEHALHPGEDALDVELARTFRFDGA